MKIKKIKVAYKDRRGKIIDILEKVPIEYVTIISSKPGAVRGNHYHRESTQFVYMLKGKIKIYSKMPGGKVRIDIISKGDLAYNPPKEEHTLVALTYSEFLVFTRGPRGGRNYEKDTYRLEKKLA